MRNSVCLAGAAVADPILSLTGSIRDTRQGSRIQSIPDRQMYGCEAVSGPEVGLRERPALMEAGCL